MEFTGEFETHITVRLQDAESISMLQGWATDHRLKCLHIVLDRGDTVSQPMLTRHGHGTLSTELATASDLSQALNATGFEVVRIKIEVAPWNHDVPQTVKDALAQPPGRYFEHHVKLRIARCAETASLADIAAQHGAHLSRNALKVRTDGFEERFVTQRCWAMGRTEAHQRLDALMHAIVPLGYPVLDVEEEFVVYDSNRAIDAGWIHGEIF